MEKRALLLVTDDKLVTEQVLALAAPVGLQPEVLSGSEAALAEAAWESAELVLVGSDAVTHVRALPRRRDVILVATNRSEDSVCGSGTDFDVVVLLPTGGRWLAERFAALGRDHANLASVVAVAGARGGAGASTTAVALAMCAADRGARVLLVDTDDTGSGLDLVLGMEDVDGIRWPGLSGLTEPIAAEELLPVLPAAGGLRLVSGDRERVGIGGEAVSAVISTARRAVDIIVVDCARGSSAAAKGASSWAAHGLLVVPAEARAVVSATSAAKSLAPRVRDLRLLVRGPAPAGLAAATVADVVGLPLAGSVRAEPGLEVALEHGDPPRPRGPLRRFCGDYLDSLGQAA